MDRYEYKLVKAPQTRRRYQGVKKGDDTFAHTLMDTINDIAREGWQFVGKEVMTERRRSGLFARRRVEHDYLVFRRALRTDGISWDAHVAPRRVRQETPDVERLRSRIRVAVSENAAANTSAAAASLASVAAKPSMR